ncbi:inorganic phosphate transporter [Tessaracoccus sp. OH4464_COT-324]|uniref:inorganic phosphate transporter n=1 Tax=Tessaracoccus sp. OH4464_COT-324 TaxID=2491059 RepID=UPI000F63A5D4|nr:inorganic phosphate transporter [Tessaracoccus sp. OH4464_COT-324]RRD47350.1 phosphate permease [Tessaracoccus sp. OH4464_COT-324]
MPNTDSTVADADGVEKKRFLGADRNWHLSFGGMMAVAFVAFSLWSIGYVNDFSLTVILMTSIALGLFMAFNIGGNDVANSFGTSVGAKTLTMKQALLVAAIFEVSGAVLAGSAVTDTVRSGIVDLDGVSVLPIDFVIIMMSSLFGAAVWLLIATKFGLPVSTTHSIIGAIVGASLTLGYVTSQGTLEMVQWSGIRDIAISWVLSPVLGGTVAFFLFGAIQRHILMYNEKAEARLRELNAERIRERDKQRTEFSRLTELQQVAYTNKLVRDSELAKISDIDPSELESDYYRALKKIDKQVDEVKSHRALTIGVPLVGAVGAVVIGAMLLVKGLGNLDLAFSPVSMGLVLTMIGSVVWLALSMFANSLRGKQLSKATFTLFSWMQVFTAAAFAFSHGSNDIANAVGPFAAILDVLRTGQINDKTAVPAPVLFAFGVALVCGLWFIGRAVIRTVGEGLTKIHPASGFAAELSAAAVVMLASVLGLPVSSTHILIGAVLGVGLVNKAANWRLMRPIFLAWVITLPVAAGLGALGFIALRTVI